MSFTFENPAVLQTAQRIHRLSEDLRLIAELKAPGIREIVEAPVLTDWALGQTLEPALVGRVAGHPSVRDGLIVTSGLYFLDPVAGYARTLNRWYRLDGPGRGLQSSAPSRN